MGHLGDSTLENFQVESKVMGYECNFCKVNDHSSFLCSKYPSLKERLAHCKEINLCTLCASTKHSSSFLSWEVLNINVGHVKVKVTQVHCALRLRHKLLPMYVTIGDRIRTFYYP